MTNIATKKIVLAGLFLALGLILPFLTMQIPSLGQALLPMHIPVLLAGFVLGGPWGLLIGLVTPALRSALFGVPPMFPHAVAMSFELAAYGLCTGLLYMALPRKNWAAYVALISAMVIGRVVWGAVRWIMLGFAHIPLTWEIFIADAFLNAIPGIILQLVLIPLLVFALKRAGLMAND